jgi:WXG100 family type VII secretion target
MANAFRVNPEALADAVEQMAEFQAYAEAMLDEIDKTVANMHATWSGEAAAAHARAHAHWARGEAMMRQALAQLRAAGAGAGDNYRGAMATNRAMWA